MEPSSNAALWACSWRWALVPRWRISVARLRVHLVDDFKVCKAGSSQAVGAHLAGTGQPLDFDAASSDGLDQVAESLQGLTGFEICCRLCAKLHRGIDDIVGPFEAHSAAHSGNRIYQQTDTAHLAHFRALGIDLLHHLAFQVLERLGTPGRRG